MPIIVDSCKKLQTAQVSISRGLVQLIIVYPEKNYKIAMKRYEVGLHVCKDMERSSRNICKNVHSLKKN